MIDPRHNTATIRVLQGGVPPVGVIRRSERGNDGTWHDALLMDLLADEITGS